MAKTATGVARCQTDQFKQLSMGGYIHCIKLREIICHFDLEHQLSETYKENLVVLFKHWNPILKSKMGNN